MRTEVLEMPEKIALNRVTERRLTERVRKKWARIARDGLPSLKEIESINFGPDRQFCFAVDLRQSGVLPYFLFVGEELAAYSTIYPMGDPRREKTLLDAAIAKMDEAALTCEPIEFSDIKQLDDGRRVAFRSILLPASENGVEVTHIFGAASCRAI